MTAEWKCEHSPADSTLGVWGAFCLLKDLPQDCLRSLGAAGLLPEVSLLSPGGVLSSPSLPQGSPRALQGYVHFSPLPEVFYCLLGVPHSPDLQGTAPGPDPSL